MSGFRKFRSSVHRRRRTIEAVELGHLVPGGEETAKASGEVEGKAKEPLTFSASREAAEIGPAPIAFVRPRKPEVDH